ncbi:MAG: NAD(P)H-hydrate epimerase [Planctomycetes bacterium]|nr:NAD(P)H-hydrate epimerase [Planctomycetota bacterium]
MSIHALTRDEVRELDRIAIEELGIPGVVLMENAGRGAAEALLAAFQLAHGRAPRVVSIVCGRGNNGGDGYVVARHLRARGVEVRVASLCPGDALPGDALSGDARTMRTICERSGFAIATLARPDPRWLDAVGDVWVDGILGTGFRGELRDDALAWVRALDACRAPLRVALDLPSGLDADLGVARPIAPHVDLTTTFAAPKVGFATAEARAHLGRVEVISIGTPPELVERVLESKRRPGTQGAEAATHHPTSIREES